MAKWADAQDVKKRLGVSGTAKGYTDTDIDEQLERATEEVRSELESQYSTDTLDAWTAKTSPNLVKNIVADLAAAYFFANIYGESVTDRMSRACSYYTMARDRLKSLLKKETEIIDKDGAEVSQTEAPIYHTRATRTKVFSMTHPDDSDAGDGSLDNF